MSRSRNVPPVSNLDGLVVLTVGIVSFVSMCALISVLGVVSYGGIAAVIIVSGACTGLAMRITNRRAWARQAQRSMR